MAHRKHIVTLLYIYIRYAIYFKNAKVSTATELWKTAVVWIIPAPDVQLPLYKLNKLWEGPGQPGLLEFTLEDGEVYVPSGSSVSLHNTSAVALKAAPSGAALASSHSKVVSES